MKRHSESNFLSWASQHGLGLDPRYPNSAFLTLLPNPELARFWIVPPEPERRPYFLACFLYAFGDWSSYRCWRHLGSWLAQPDEKRINDQIEHAILRGIGLSGGAGDIPLLNPKAKERAGYPTQKPILLLERIISLITSPGELVLDPFCGSGTTLVAAELLGRNSVGIDASIEAVELARHRLAQPVRTSSELMRRGRESYLQTDEESLAVLCGLPVIPVQRNRGIDAILNSKPGENPILIRVQRRGENLADAAESLDRAGRTKQPATLVLIVTDSRQPNGLFNVLPANIVLINSTATELLDQLTGRGIGTPKR